jgi:tRNA G46 methylase TrmB
MTIASVPKAATLAHPVTAGFRNATQYDLHRPSYPASAVSSLLAHLGIEHAARSRIVEIGAGTGKFTQLLAGRDEGFEIVAAEPHEAMRGSLLGKALRGVRVVDGDAGNVPVEDGWGDACVAAQVSSENCVDGRGSA